MNVRFQYVKYGLFFFNMHGTALQNNIKNYLLEKNNRNQCEVGNNIVRSVVIV